MNSEEKRILKIPADKLIISPSGRLDYPDELPVCTNASYIPECLKCRLVVSSIVYTKSSERHFPKLFQRCKNHGCYDIFPLGKRLEYTLERMVRTDRLCGIDDLSPEMYDQLYPIILDMYDKDYEKDYEFYKKPTEEDPEYSFF
jgi:hypothetical protein